MPNRLAAVRPLVLGAAALALLSTASTSEAFAAETVVDDDWYAVYVNGRKSGHARIRLLRGEHAGQSVWISETENHIQLSRMGKPVALDITERVVEDQAGRVLAFRQSQKTSADAVVTEGELRGGRMHLVQNGVESDVGYPSGALGPAAVDRAMRGSGMEPGATTRTRQFSTEVPAQAADVTFTIEAKDSKTVLGRTLRLSRCRVTNQASPRAHVLWLDGTGRMQIAETEIAGVGSMRMVRAPESLALAATRPAEIFRDSLVTPDRGIARPRRARRAVFRLRRPKGGLGTLYSGDGQTVRRLGPDAAEIEVTRWALPEGFESAPRPFLDDGLERFLARSAYLDIDDAEVRRRAAEAVADETTALASARRIETYVREFVGDKGLDVGFATASEVARSRVGDCTEHAVLSAALARAAGLPSRVVVGLVFVPGMSAPGVGPRGAFGYHMWTEVLVAEDVWFAIDAALGSFDATHIALTKSDLSTTSPVTDLVLPLLDVLGGLEIEVVDVQN